MAPIDHSPGNSATPDPSNSDTAQAANKRRSRLIAGVVAAAVVAAAAVAIPLTFGAPALAKLGGTC